MTRFPSRRQLQNEKLPVEIVLHPSWWHRHAGITFDLDFFYHPSRRVEAERQMEEVLHERFGRFGLGADRKRDLPLVGAVHNAAGYLVSEMLGCRVEYSDSEPPRVLPGNRADLVLDAEAAFESPAFRRFERLLDSLKAKYGFLVGDVNFGGVLNTALDLRGQELFTDFFDRPLEVHAFLAAIADCIDRFTRIVEKETGSTSVSVNRLVRHLRGPVFLHSECTHTMISEEFYETFLLEIDRQWSLTRRPFGIHYCGRDPHRFAALFARLPHLDFLDVGWGGDIGKLRECLPTTFLNIRLSPVEILGWSPGEVRAEVTRLVEQSADPVLTGVCCINMDSNVDDGTITAILETVADLRERYSGSGKNP